jgi:mycofactocin precursor
MTTVEAPSDSAIDQEQVERDRRSEPSEPVVEVLVEEISIDGMCGVY